eukprot:CAMPEP_0114514302 /NCGR_PEP_ID=MMETSP0109-20121206/16076_1 /TAXON_ID=29199 /ORGANISM="Chlorarachnion reptans, Strain CCCM449" /LENGTH=341 /DNA_ID=CAMNT_0001694323 /DNA_START=260 /DNA_END=1285 /DNA_ORIENTATION=-
MISSFQAQSRGLSARSTPGGFDMDAMMKDPEIAKQYKEAMNNPEIQRMVNEQMKVMQNPEFIRRIESLKNDPEMAAIFQEMESGGMNAMMKYYNDPNFLNKLTEKMGDMSDIMSNAGVQPPPMTGNMAGMDQMMSDPDMLQKFQQLSNDPEIAPMLQKIREGGPEGLQSAMSDPALLQKFQKKMDEIGIDQNKLASMTAGAGGPAPAAAPAAPPAPEIETLIDAARYGDVEAAEDLTFVGKDVNLRDGEQRTPIHWACAGGHVDVAKILIENGADLSALDSKGNTPLHYATGYGQPEAARVLLDAGVDTSIKNGNGKTSKEVVTLNPSNPISKDSDLMARL